MPGVSRGGGRALAVPGPLDLCRAHGSKTYVQIASRPNRSTYPSVCVGPGSIHRNRCQPLIAIRVFNLILFIPKTSHTPLLGFLGFAPKQTNRNELRER